MDFNRHSPFKFGLADLFGLIFVVAMIMAARGNAAWHS
jgi:hypothetical protein